MNDKLQFVFLSAFIFMIGISCSQEKTSDFPVLKGPYLGQELPGMAPQVLAPGFISTNDFELCSGFLKSGEVFVFNRQPRGHDDFNTMPTYITELKDGKWTQLYLVPFNEYYPYNFTTSPDNKTLYFTSKRAANSSGTRQNPNIWKTRITADGWSKPVMLDPPINTEWSDNYPSITGNGTLYFMSNREGGFGSVDIYRCELINGKYSKVENLGDVINTENPEQDPVIAPDESYLIFCSETLEGFGGYDLYVTYRNSDRSWTEPINMGPEINSSDEESRANITPDGKFILFMRGTSDYANIYWADAQIIKDMKPKELK